TASNPLIEGSQGIAPQLAGPLVILDEALWFEEGLVESVPVQNKPSQPAVHRCKRTPRSAVESREGPAEPDMNHVHMVRPWPLEKALHSPSPGGGQQVENSQGHSRSFVR